MKIFFTGSTSKLKQDRSKFEGITDVIESLGHENTNYIHFPPTSRKFREAVKDRKFRKLSLYGYCMHLINNSDILVADITTPSMKVGYQIDYALNRKIPSLVLYKRYKGFVVPVVLRHSYYGLLMVKEYKKIEEIKEIIKNFVVNVKTSSIKFNFYLTLELHNYISRRAETERKNKSDIIREILEKESRSNPI